MAKGNLKRIASQNSASLSLLQKGLLVSQAIYLISLLFFTTNKTKKRIAYYVITSGIELVLVGQLFSMGKAKLDGQGNVVSAGDDLTQSGLTAYMFDVIYITWAVHIGTALFTRYFWYLYLSVGLDSSSSTFGPMIKRRFFPSFGSPSTVAATPEKEEGGMSKRQSKFQKRYGEGQRVKYSRS